VLGDIEGCLGCIVCKKRLKLSCHVDECKPLAAGGGDDRRAGVVASQRHVRGVHGRADAAQTHPARAQHFNGGAAHSFPFQLNLSRFGHTSPCPPV
jgi:hypothetical protein